MKVLIVGAGLTGLTLANLLAQKNYQVHICEMADDFINSPYSIALWPTGSRILKGLGLYEVYEKKSTLIEHYQINNENGNTLGSYNMSNVMGNNDPLRTIVIGDLQQILADNFKKERIRFGRNIKTILPSQTNVEVMYNDGGVESFDLIVGCDGKNSGVRNSLFPKVQSYDTSWSGWAWRVNSDFSFMKNRIQEIWAKGKYLSIYPANNGTFCFGAIPNSNISENAAIIDSAFIQEKFSSLGESAQQILSYQQNIKDISFWKFTDLRETKWFMNRVVLVGDACASIIPVASMGAASGMESAAVLADELGRADGKTVNNALKLYYKRHFVRINEMQKNSRKAVGWKFINGKFRTLERNLLIEMGNGVTFFKEVIDLLNQPL